LPSESTGQALTVLTALAKAISDAAASFDKFADGLWKLAKLGDFVGLPVSEAERAQQRLQGIRARTVGLTEVQRGIFIQNLEVYIVSANGGAPADELSKAWDGGIRNEISDLLRVVETLLKDLENERSGFVNTPAYKEFVSVLSARVSLL